MSCKPPREVLADAWYDYARNVGVTCPGCKNRFKVSEELVFDEATAHCNCGERFRVTFYQEAEDEP